MNYSLLPVRTLMVATSALVLLSSCKQAETPVPSPTAAPVSQLSVDAVFDAAMAGDTAQVAQALEQNFDANQPGPDGRSLLMSAAFNGHSDTLRLLLDHGAEVNRRDIMGRSALMYAATGPFAESVELLLKQGAKINQADLGEHWTALMFAAAEGHADVVNLLLAQGADAQAKDIDGDSAADFASNNGHTDLAETLRKAAQNGPHR